MAGLASGDRGYKSGNVDRAEPLCGVSAGKLLLVLKVELGQGNSGAVEVGSACVMLVLAAKCVMLVFAAVRDACVRCMCDACACRQSLACWRWSSARAIRVPSRLVLRMLVLAAKCVMLVFAAVCDVCVCCMCDACACRQSLANWPNRQPGNLWAAKVSPLGVCCSMLRPRALALSVVYLRRSVKDKTSSSLRCSFAQHTGWMQRQLSSHSWRTFRTTSTISWRRNEKAQRHCCLPANRIPNAVRHPRPTRATIRRHLNSQHILSAGAWIRRWPTLIAGILRESESTV